MHRAAQPHRTRRHSVHRQRGRRPRVQDRRPAQPSAVPEGRRLRADRRPHGRLVPRRRGAVRGHERGEPPDPRHRTRRGGVPRRHGHVRDRRTVRRRPAIPPACEPVRDHVVRIRRGPGEPALERHGLLERRGRGDRDHGRRRGRLLLDRLHVGRGRLSGPVGDARHGGVRPSRRMEE